MNFILNETRRREDGEAKDQQNVLFIDAKKKTADHDVNVALADFLTRERVDFA